MTDELSPPVPESGDEPGDGRPPAADGAAGGPSDHVRQAARRAIEALVLVAEEPMASHLLAQLLEVSPVVVDALCRELAEGYEAEGRGFQLVRVAGGWRYQSHPEQAPYVERPTSSAWSSRARRPSCRRRRWRRWPSWPTSSPSPGPRWPPSGA
jgi:hypothetical protein